MRGSSGGRELGSRWMAFLTELDAALPGAMDLHGMGGFVVSQCYGLGRTTADLDVVAVGPGEAMAALVEVAGEGSALHRKHRVWRRSGVASYPADYAERLVRCFPYGTVAPVGAGAGLKRRWSHIWWAGQPGIERRCGCGWRLVGRVRWLRRLRFGWQCYAVWETVPLASRRRYYREEARRSLPHYGAFG